MVGELKIIPPALRVNVATDSEFKLIARQVRLFKVFIAYSAQEHLAIVIAMK